jgi:hypothetical protein
VPLRTTGAAVRVNVERSSDVEDRCVFVRSCMCNTASLDACGTRRAARTSCTPFFYDAMKKDIPDTAHEFHNASASFVERKGGSISCFGFQSNEVPKYFCILTKSQNADPRMFFMCSK